MNYTPNQALRKLIAGNEIYLNSKNNPGNISSAIRYENSIHGQHPYSVILTCSDSRVPPEHIFSAGVGELFVIRTAGNVVGGFELGTIEYGLKYLGVPLILVMGHSQCGAVAAALDGNAEGYIEDVVHEIQLGLYGATDEVAAVYNNILNSRCRIMESSIIQKLISDGNISIVCALYDVKTGAVKFFEC
ncbi:MAG: carbonic anhydrase [Oscillospiraceae bacterium]|nr:carbonic anhydrase [Oscillospiraceae bacterium]